MGREWMLKSAPRQLERGAEAVVARRREDTAEAEAVRAVIKVPKTTATRPGFHHLRQRLMRPSVR